MHRSPVRRRNRAIAALAIVTAACTVGASAASGGAVATPSDAIAFVPTASLPTLTWRAGKNGSITQQPFAKAVSGQFDDSDGADLFGYNPGGGLDGIIHFDPSGSDTTLSFEPLPVSGTFNPFVGDFDANGIDDIFWYAPGTAADYVWLFDAAGNHTTVRKSVGGTYRPLVIDADGDGGDDVIWYAPGATADAMWLFGAAAAHTDKAVSIGGSYTTAVGRFGLTAPGAPTEGIVFYSPSAADTLWVFDSSANHTSETLPAVSGDYRLIPGQFLEETYGSLLYYGPGSLPERLFAFGPGAGPDISEQEVPNMSGTYTVQAGDFDTNDVSDLALTSGTKTRIWYFDYDGSITSAVTGDHPTASYPVVVGMGPS
ncbi:hypothetical protein ACE2AJ_17075 [Aquihabitans daechungensis]|uniref:hypothetical protein n=1 Tax=Aquihabitans daechungensis TaxID=1052257 RepID=UPI003BA1165B